MSTINPQSEFERKNVSLFQIVIESGAIPRYLYKYRSMDSFKQCIDNSSMYFPKLSQLNDPFEGHANIQTEYTDEEWKKYLKKEGLREEEQAFLLNTAIRDKEKVSKIIKDSINNEYQNTGILCLSSENNNMLMWTHYGDMGRGVCMGFDIKEDPCFFLQPRKIEYGNYTISLNYITDNSKILDPLFHKTANWKYEQEYRVIKPKFTGLRVFEKSALKYVIFGYAVQQNDIDDCRRILAEKQFSNVEYKKANLDFNTQSIVIENI